MRAIRRKAALFLTALLLTTGLVYLLMRPAHRTGMTGEEIYHALETQVGAFENQVRLGTIVDHAQAEQAFFRLCYVHPEYFWLKSCSYTDGEDGTCIEIDMPYTREEIAEMYRRLDARASQIIDRMPSYTTDYSRVLYLHDYLVTHTEPADTSETGRIYDAYGALVEGRAVCSGYSQAMVLLLQRAGIPCGICEGLAGGSRHSWNYACVSGVYYWIDATWDDPAGTELVHDYCLTDDAHLQRSRQVDTDSSLYYIPFVPVCGSMEQSYFAMNGTLLDSYDPQVLSALIRSHSGRLELMFTQHSDYTACLHALLEEGYFRTIPGMEERALTVTQNDQMDTLVLEYGR